MALANQVQDIAIIDNGSARFDEARLRETYRSLIVKRLGANRGIGAAQNEGMALARRLGHEYVLLLDQDSVPEHGMVERLRAVLEELHKAGHKVGCVGPRIRLPGSGNLSRFGKIGWATLRYSSCQDSSSAVECDVLISSGSLIPLDVVGEIGVMEEDLFIDQVDTEWCLRARAKGYKIYGACSAVLEHRLGEGVAYIWIGRWRRLPRHKPFRYYYIFRNSILLSRRKYASWKWILFNARSLAALFLLFGVFTRDRKGELGMMATGMLHGIRGITGKLGN